MSKNQTVDYKELSWVYGFDQIADLEKILQKHNPNFKWTDVKAVLGGKGAGLSDMARIGIPVPPGFTITTRACIAFQDKNAADDENDNDGVAKYSSMKEQFPSGMWDQVKDGIRAMEKAMEKGFGSKENPLLISVRSGAPISMPGMMDTILNLGINETTLQGIAKLTQDERFAWDSYRRFVQMFSKIVLGVDEEKLKECHNDKLFEDMTLEEIKETVNKFHQVVRKETGKETPIPSDPWEQLEMAIGAVFKSWNGKRARDYRRLHYISDDLGTAVNVQTMIFGNMGKTSATGVAFTRNPSTGESSLYGEYLINAQGEDVVAGIRTPQNIYEMKNWNEKVFKQFQDIAQKLEDHYKDMQDMEFTVQNGKLWMLQTRNGKRSGVAAVRVAVDMVHEGRLSVEEAVARVDPEALNQLLHPIVDPKASVELLAKGNPASPGAAYGKIVFDADHAEKLSKEGQDIILARPETSPDDIHGLAAARGLVTSHGGMTSHAAVVARSIGKPCVTGISAFNIIPKKKVIRVSDGTELKEFDEITIDGTTGKVLKGKAPVRDPELSGHFAELMEWAAKYKKIKIYANADTPEAVETAIKFGAEGIGLVRTEHMFFQPERIIYMQKMVMSSTEEERRESLKDVLGMQREDFEGIFQVVRGKPVTIRTLDPPLHEFLPHSREETEQLAKKLGLEADAIEKKLDTLKEANPMLGLRGCRLGIKYPEITETQARAIFEAAANVQAKNDFVVSIEVMIPLVTDLKEFSLQAKVIRKVAAQVKKERKLDKLDFKVGTMIELPRAALTADEIAQEAEFFSFGTNDLTQTTFGISRDDSGLFLEYYVDQRIYEKDPFSSLDEKGVGKLVKMGLELGRKTNPTLKVGICGEHGGDPDSVQFCSNVGMNYVSCSSFRVPIARLAAAQASLKEK